MPAYVFKHSDAGAPVLSGTAGALITVLDALLVNGYNSKTITITRSGATATGNCTTHGFVKDQRLLIAGADQTEYTGEFRINVTDANNFTFTVTGTPTTPATGTITAKVASLGWTKSYTGTNKAAYRQKSGTNQFYFRVDDTNAQNSQMRGYEAMTDVDTGTNPFPTIAQFALGSGLYIYKSSTANSTAREWKMWSNGKIFYLLTFSGATAGRLNGTAFGDFFSRLPGDAYNTVMIGETTASFNSNTVFAAQLAGVSTVGAGHFIARPSSGAAGASTAGKFGHYSLSAGSSYLGYGTTAIPDPIMGGINMVPVLLNEPGISAVRGVLPGWWSAPHVTWAGWANGDTMTGAAGSSIDGIKFEWHMLYSAVTGGTALFDISGETWDSDYGG
jgi:hypothetical protein